MSIETKRGYRITLQGKEVIISCPDERDAKMVFESLQVNILLAKYTGLRKYK